MIKPSLCCIHNGLKHNNNLSFNTITYTRFKSLSRDEGIRVLSSRLENNLRVIYHILEICGKAGWNYRIGQFFPLATLPEADVRDMTMFPNYNIIKNLFIACKYIIKKYNIRVSTHPSQFTVLASPNQKTVEASIREINHVAAMLDLFGTEPSHMYPINLHMSSYKGNLNDIVKRFQDGFELLSPSAKKRLVIENEDKPNTWCVKELIDIFYPKTEIPITFDYLHNITNRMMNEKTAITECVKTWKNIIPLFHYSESKSINNPREHADFPTYIPNDYGYKFNLDIELKAKELAVIKFMELQNNGIKN